MPKKRLTDSKKKRPMIKVSGILMEADEVQISGRVYPKEVLKEAVEKAQETIKHKLMFGTLGFQDYPITMPPQNEDISPEDDWEDTFGGSMASHFVSNLEMKETGEVMVECVVLDTPEGDRLKRVLVSCVPRARGFGQIVERDGRKFVEDYTLQSVDFVRDD